MRMLTTSVLARFSRLTYEHQAADDGSAGIVEHCQEHVRNGAQFPAVAGCAVLVHLKQIRKSEQASIYSLSSLVSGSSKSVKTCLSRP